MHLFDQLPSYRPSTVFLPSCSVATVLPSCTVLLRRTDTEDGSVRQTVASYRPVGVVANRRKPTRRGWGY